MMSDHASGVLRSGPVVTATLFFSAFAMSVARSPPVGGTAGSGVPISISSGLTFEPLAFSSPPISMTPPSLGAGFAGAGLAGAGGFFGWARALAAKKDTAHRNATHARRRTDRWYARIRRP